jgi:hypothetical protein
MYFPVHLEPCQPAPRAKDPGAVPYRLSFPAVVHSWQYFLHAQVNSGRSEEEEGIYPTSGNSKFISILPVLVSLW